MKKKLSALALALVLALSLCLTGCGGSDTLTLNVYNWGEYISDGSDGSLDTIHAFEDWYELSLIHIYQDKQEGPEGVGAQGRVIGPEHPAPVPGDGVSHSASSSAISDSSSSSLEKEE